jgi:hypothetical protein
VGFTTQLPSPVHAMFEASATVTILPTHAFCAAHVTSHRSLAQRIAPTHPAYESQAMVQRRVAVQSIVLPHAPFPPASIPQPTEQRSPLQVIGPAHAR